MVKQLSTANTNRYKDAQTPLEVKLSFKKDSKKKVDTQAAVQQKWKKWDMGQRDAMQTLATYLFRIEKELRGQPRRQQKCRLDWVGLGGLGPRPSRRRHIVNRQHDRHRKLIRRLGALDALLQPQPPND